MNKPTKDALIAFIVSVDDMVYDCVVAEVGRSLFDYRKIRVLTDYPLSMNLATDLNRFISHFFPAEADHE